MNRKKVTINEKELEISKMSLGKIAKFIGGLQEIPAIFDEFDKFDKDTLIQGIPTMIATSAKEFYKLMALATGVSESVVRDEWGIADIIIAVNTVLEVNDFDLIKKNSEILIGKFSSKPSQPSQENSVGTSEKS